jgi:hypothetical protein
MAPHLSDQELDKIQKWQGLETTVILERLTKARERKGLGAPGLHVVQRALKGKTFRRGVTETRGRKKMLTRNNVKKLNSVRKDLIKKAKGEREIHWNEIIRKARVPDVHPTTAARALTDSGIQVAARKPREKPMRKPEHEHNRLEICTKWAKLPATYFADKIDLIMDNKKWDLPMTKIGKRFNKMKKVRFHLRTKEEGLRPGFTKPKGNKQRVNTGGKVDVCAGIIGGKIKLWHYLPKQNWCGKVAEATYRGPIAAALKKHVGEGRRYTIMEDNDPTGYKSKLALKAKADLKVRAVEFPAYSPDLNPLDFYVWAEVERRMGKQKEPKNESQAQYKARLRRTAMALPAAVVRKAVMSIKKRAKAVVEAKGGDISRD